jgi:hypothetical protein
MVLTMIYVALKMANQVETRLQVKQYKALSED